MFIGLSTRLKKVKNTVAKSSKRGINIDMQAGNQTNGGRAMTSEIKRHDPIEIGIMFVRYCGPVTKAQIERELLAQCTFTKTKADAKRQAAKVIAHGLKNGWLARYDAASYDMA